MDHQYNTINQCLQLLKQSDIPTIKKLRVEIQLIQMKRLLLNEDITPESIERSCSLEVFEDMLFRMRGISSGSAGPEAIGDLLTLLGGIIAELGGDQPPSA